MPHKNWNEYSHFFWKNSTVISMHREIRRWSRSITSSFRMNNLPGIGEGTFLNDQNGVLNEMPSLQNAIPNGSGLKGIVISLFLLAILGIVGIFLQDFSCTTIFMLWALYVCASKVQSQQKLSSQIVLQLQSLHNIATCVCKLLISITNFAEKLTSFQSLHFWTWSPTPGNFWNTKSRSNWGYCYARQYP